MDAKWRCSRKETAPRAVQFISLTGSSWELPFNHQRQALDNIRAYVGTVLSCTVEDSTRKPGTVYFQRLVFTKVCRVLVICRHLLRIS